MGAGLSGICLAHCLLLPMVGLLFAGRLPAGWNNEFIHAALLFSVLPVALITLGMGYRQHGKRRVITMGTIGMAAMIAGFLLAETWGESAEKTLTLTGGLILALAHLQNYRCRCCQNPH
ncbi:MAG: MerC domain-containing protein [Acidobacteriota bacterium]|nr:MerC domain-containing protein [Acidobacteriota bacterium]